MSDTAGIYANDPNLRAVQLGLDVQHFITHNKVGMYLIERAHQDRAAALEALAEVDPLDSARVRELQWRARTPELFLGWLDEAIAGGEAAEETIVTEEAAERY